MFFTRIKRGAVRAFGLVRNKFDLYRSRQVPAFRRLPRVAGLTFMAGMTAVLPVPHPSHGTLALADGGEPPSTTSASAARLADAAQAAVAADAIQISTVAAAGFANHIVIAPSRQTLDDQRRAEEERVRQEQERERIRQELLAQQRREQERQQQILEQERQAARALAEASAAGGDVVATIHEWTARDLGEDQWPAVYAIGMRESGFSPGARNPYSGACGIWQANPCGKMGGMSLQTQWNWFKGYLPRYGSARAAWQFWQGHSWW